MNKFLTNRYTLVLVGFIVWMVFFDTNSWFVHQQLDKEIEKLEHKKLEYQAEIEKTKKAIEKISTPQGLEWFAREQYYMKKKGETIYLIED